MVAIFAVPMIELAARRFAAICGDLRRFAAICVAAGAKHCGFDFRSVRFLAIVRLWPLSLSQVIKVVDLVNEHKSHVKSIHQIKEKEVGLPLCARI